MKVVDPLYLRATHSPDRLFLVTPGRSWSCLEAEMRIQQITSVCISYGIDQGKRVGILATNQPDYIFWVLALTRIRAVSVCLNRRLAIPSIIKQLTSIGVQYLVTNLNIELDQITLIPLSVWDIKEIELPSIQEKNSRLCQAAPTEFHRNLLGLPLTNKQSISPLLSLNEVQSIFFSSGTTGMPKPISLTLGNHFYSAIGVLSRLAIYREDRYWLICLPLFHVGAFSIIWRCLWSGTTIFLTDGFDASQVIEIVKTYPIGLISLVPTMLVRILDQPAFELNRTIWQNLHSIMIGGAPLHQKIREYCLSLKLPIAISYGLTEASSTVTLLTANEWQTQPFSVGRPIPGMAVKIEDQLIKIKGRSIFYNPSMWFNTKDIGYLNEEGYLFVIDRLDHMIICGGENIYPLEIETVLLQHPLISDACILGIPDREWGQIPVAVIVAKGSIDLQQIKEFCIIHQLDSYKIPKKIVIVDNIPKNSLGKTDRVAVKALLFDQE